MNARGRHAGAKIMERYGKKGIKKLSGRSSEERKIENSIESKSSDDISPKKKMNM